jgi:hypothetical protein
MVIYNSLLDDTVDIKTRSIESTNDWGEPLYEWETTENIKCKIFRVSYEEIKKSAGEWENIKYKIYFKNSQSLDLQDRIVYESKEYEIVDIFEDCESQFKRALVKEL